jgi:ribosome-interacting GTPase 1
VTATRLKEKSQILTYQDVENLNTEERLWNVPQHKGTMKLRGEIKKKIAVIREDLEDKKRKEEVQIRNDADALVYQGEKNSGRPWR